MYYLYVKTHNITGRKYLGYTSRNPYSYQGSGLRWKLHLKEHGNNVTTEILAECETKDEVKRFGEYYSDLYNVVENENWSNLKPETGEGGWDHVNSNREQFYLESIGVTNPAHLPDSKKKRSITNKKNSKKHIETRRKNSIRKYGVSHYSQDPDALQKRNEVLQEKYGVDNNAKRIDVREKLRQTRNSDEYKKKHFITCEHCNTAIDPGNYKRWHGDKCKQRSKNHGLG